MNIFEEYAQIKRTMTSLETRRLEIELEIMDAIDESGSPEYQTDEGTFFSHGRKSYDYSEAVAERSRELSQLKKQEEVDGIATLKKVTAYVRFIPKGVNNG